MRASTNALLVGAVILALSTGWSNAQIKKNSESFRSSFDQLHGLYQEAKAAPVQRPTIDVRPALWTDAKLPATYSTVSYAGDCAGGTCSILGLARRESAGVASGPVRRVFAGLGERGPVRRLFGRLRCR